MEWSDVEWGGVGWSGVMWGRVELSGGVGCSEVVCSAV